MDGVHYVKRLVRLIDLMVHVYKKTPVHLMRYNLDTLVLISHVWYIHNIVYSKLIIETYKTKFLVAESSLLIPFDIRRFDNIHTIHT